MLYEKIKEYTKIIKLKQIEDRKMVLRSEGNKEMKVNDVVACVRTHALVT